MADCYCFNLTNDENKLVLSSFDVDSECLVVTIGQVYTFTPPRAKNWELLDTGALYILKDRATSKITMCLFNVLSRLIMWSEDVYEELEIKFYDKILIFEGQKSVILLNFAFNDECLSFQETIYQHKNDSLYITPENESNEYAHADEEYHYYENAPGKGIQKSKNSFLKRSTGWFFKKIRKNSETPTFKPSISGPVVGTFKHVARGIFDENGFTIEGMQPETFYKLLEEAGITMEMYEENKDIVDDFILTHKDQIIAEQEFIQHESPEKLSTNTEFFSTPDLRQYFHEIDNIFNGIDPHHYSPLCEEDEDSSLATQSVVHKNGFNAKTPTNHSIPNQPGPLKPKPKLFDKPSLSPRPNLLPKPIIGRPKPTIPQKINVDRYAKLPSSAFNHKLAQIQANLSSPLPHSPNKPVFRKPVPSPLNQTIPSKPFLPQVNKANHIKSSAITPPKETPQPNIQNAFLEQIKMGQPNLKPIPKNTTNRLSIDEKSLNNKTNNPSTISELLRLTITQRYNKMMMTDDEDSGDDGESKDYIWK